MCEGMLLQSQRTPGVGGKTSVETAEACGHLNPLGSCTWEAALTPTSGRSLVPVYQSPAGLDFCPSCPALAEWEGVPGQTFPIVTDHSARAGYVPLQMLLKVGRR